ncbi:hypothetical protein [Candidatus Laterigemmans baculatus]|uniref:hypothetical protein n=1 Tax=Candidatus Laterigemmans baculatus TaxID=2770505 RepID=UPI001F3BE568|nr:hypothetical protein [Candidatus Laterigemmans baculatus]
MKRFTSIGLSALLMFAISGRESLRAEAESAPESGVNRSAAARGPHGGRIHQTGGVQIETVVAPGGLLVFGYDRQGQPISLSQGRGIASLQIEGGAKRYRYDLLPDGRGALAVAVDLSKIAGRQVELNYQFVGLTAASGPPIGLSEVSIVPESPQQRAAAAAARQAMQQASERLQVVVAKATPADAKLIARQATCPVMDEPLGSMGGPVKLVVGDRPIFLCCKGCIKKVQSEPAKYFAKVHGDASANASGALAAVGGEQVRPGVYKTVAADLPFITAQKTCPVMDEPLDSMGGPYRVEAEGRAVYICCPGCAKKVAADPQKYLAVLAEKGVNAPELR